MTTQLEFASDRAATLLRRKPVLLMTPPEFEQITNREERTHFMFCKTCGEYYDMRQLHDVMFHNTGHKPRPDIQYGGSER